MVKNKKLFRPNKRGKTKKFLTFGRLFGFVFIIIIGGVVALNLSHAYSGNHAECSLVQLSATTVYTNQTFTGKIQMRNDGTTTWTPAGQFLKDRLNNWAMAGGKLTTSIAPGHTATFNVTLHAQSTAGPHQLMLGMAAVSNNNLAFAAVCATRTINIVNPPAPKPKPKPKPTPSPTPPTYTPQPVSGSTTVADKTSPSVPKNFMAKVNDSTEGINLTWKASSDNIGVAKYILGRSTDQRHWHVLSSSIKSTSYSDVDGQFNTHYYYRLQAVDTSGNKSGYAKADIVSSDFTANTNSQQDTTIISDDTTVSMLIPAGALKMNAYCILTSSDSILPPSLSGYKPVKGPYTLGCRDENGKSITTFSKSLTLTVKINQADLKGVGGLKYLGQNGDGNWQDVTLTSQDAKAGIDTANLDNTTTVVVMGKIKKTPAWIKITFTILGIVVLVVLIRFIRNKMIYGRAAKQQDEYFRKSHGL